jgi:hypothetical protein
MHRLCRTCVIRQSGGTFCRTQKTTAQKYRLALPGDPLASAFGAALS